MPTAKKSSFAGKKTAQPAGTPRGAGTSTPTFGSKGGGRTVRPASKTVSAWKGAQLAEATRELMRTQARGPFKAGTPVSRAPAVKVKQVKQALAVRGARSRGKSGGVWDFLTPEFGKQVAPAPAAALDRETTRTLTKKLGLVFGTGRVRLVPEGILIATGPAADGDLPMTTQEAADMVGVSRPFLTKQVDEGKIALHGMAGNQRRVLRKDVLAWHARLREGQKAASTELGKLLDEEIFGEA